VEDITGTLNTQLAGEIFSLALEGAQLPHDINPEQLAEINFGKDPFLGYFYDAGRKESVVVISNHKRLRYFYIRSHTERGKTQYRFFSTIQGEKITMPMVLDALKGWDGDRAPEKIPDLTSYRPSTGSR